MKEVGGDKVQSDNDHRHEIDNRSLSRMRTIVKHISSGEPHSGDKPSNSNVRWNGWGYEDTKLYINRNGDVEISGSRYGEVFHNSRDRSLPHLRPWAEKVIGLDVKRTSFPSNTQVDQLSFYTDHLNEQLQIHINEFVKLLQKLGIKSSSQVEDRVKHSHGQTCEDIFRLRHENDLKRIPDAVAWPQSHEQVKVIVREGTKRGICLVPHGGGTNVSNALECDINEHRAIFSVDLREMTRILQVDKENMLILVETGITGLELHERLRNKGLTLGHEPDSWEFSTLGGWLATKASGMKKNIYGNIEDLVVNITMVTAQGTMRKTCNVPRVSMGPDMVQASLGSEGIFGIFTQAMLRVRTYPSHQVYDSLLFPDFAHGIATLNEVMRQKCVPASIRLLDNVQFQLGQALKPSPSKSSSHLAAGVKSLSTSVIDLAKKAYVTKIKGFDPNTLCAATVLMEGTKEEVESQQSKIRAIARKHQGLIGGAENGQRGYFFTYIIAYLRDFAMDYYFLSESFETCVPWTNIRQLCSDLKKAISSEAAKKNVVVPPLVCCRVTQLYETGVCVYVYYGINYYGIKDPLSLFKAIENIAVEVIIANGGSLSHHHGVGKHRQKWLQGTISAPAIQAIQGIKKALDPNNIFATGNLLKN